MSLPHATCLTGDLRLPGDKSISHRSLMFLSMAKGQGTITNLSPGQDVMSTLSCMRALGATITPGPEANSWHVSGAPLQAPTETLDCGNSGTTIRLLSGILCGANLPATLTGDESLCKRPMRRILDPLQAMGANITAEGPHGAAPLTIQAVQGGIQGIRYQMPMASAQVKSAVLLAGLYAPTEATVSVIEPLPSRDHTERMLNAMGVGVDTKGDTVTLSGRVNDLTAQDIDVPGDISSAAFWLVGAAILPGSRVTLRRISFNPSRLGVLTTLSEAGAEVSVHGVGETVGEPYGDLTVEGVRLSGDINITPDLVPSLIDEIPILTILGLFTEGTMTVRGAEELRVKESDRLGALIRLLETLGVAVTAFEDGFTFTGNPDWEIPVIQEPIQTHHDHRLVMALEILNLRAKTPVPIAGREWVAVSYPAFHDTLAQLLAQPAEAV